MKIRRLETSRTFRVSNGGTVRIQISDIPQSTGHHVAHDNFRCYGCEETFLGDPPRLRVRYDNAELRFCSTYCGLDEGFAVAVEALFEAEAAGDGDAYVWEDRRYDLAEAV